MTFHYMATISHFVRDQKGEIIHEIRHDAKDKCDYCYGLEPNVKSRVELEV